MRRRMPDFGDCRSVILSLRNRDTRRSENRSAGVLFFIRESMAKRIFYYVITAFSSAAKAAVIIALCVLVGGSLTFPLWYFATSFPSVYTAVVLSLFAAYVVYKTARAIKKSTRKTVLCIALDIVIIAAGLAVAVSLVFAGARFIAIPVIILIPVLCIISSRLLKNG